MEDSVETQNQDHKVLRYAGWNLFKNVLCAGVTIGAVRQATSLPKTLLAIGLGSASTGLTYRFVGEKFFQVRNEIRLEKSDAEWWGPGIRTGIAVIKHLVDLGVFMGAAKLVKHSTGGAVAGIALGGAWGLYRVTDSSTLLMWYLDSAQWEFYEMFLNNVVRDWTYLHKEGLKLEAALRTKSSRS